MLMPAAPAPLQLPLQPLGHMGFEGDEIEKMMIDWLVKMLIKWMVHQYFVGLPILLVYDVHYTVHHKLII